MNLQVYKGKRLGIMQPYFFPYLGYYGLIANTDQWIVFDPVQFRRKTWMTRNRVLKAGGGAKYINLKVASHSRYTLIKDICLPEDHNRFEHLIRNLDAYKLLKAPYYDKVLDVLRECYAFKSDSLVKFLSECLTQTCHYIGIPFQHEIYSNMKLEHPEATHPMDWSLYICQSLGASEYLNPPGGRAFFNTNRFKEAGIEFYYYEQILPEYNQNSSEFMDGLSIIDVMMFNSPEQIKKMLLQYRLCEE